MIMHKKEEALGGACDTILQTVQSTMEYPFNTPPFQLFHHLALKFNDQKPITYISSI
jgi:hypothetical protein